MNLSITLTGGLTRVVLNVSFFVLVFTGVNAVECFAMPQSPQSGTEATIQLNSSRRVDDKTALRDAMAQGDRPLPDDFDEPETDVGTIDTLDDQDDELSIDEPETDDSVSDEEESEDDQPEEEEDDDEKDASPLGSKMIDTDTRSLRVNIAESNATAPDDQSGELVAQSFGNALVLPSEKRFAWAAPDIRYQPLYFENVPHERYGQTPQGCELRQTVLSAAHFYGSLALLPYKLKDQHPQSCDGPLGFCRPGSETPFVWQRPIVR